VANRIELRLRLPNSPGALGAVCQALADGRVNILALGLDGRGELRLVVDNHVHAAGVLRDRHYEVVEHDALVLNVPHAPGGLAAVLALVAAAGVNVERAYGGAPPGASTAAVVIDVDDAMSAASAAGV
jgi:hypothetical protein